MPDQLVHQQADCRLPTADCRLPTADWPPTKKVSSLRYDTHDHATDAAFEHASSSKKRRPRGRCADAWRAQPPHHSEHLLVDCPDCPPPPIVLCNFPLRISTDTLVKESPANILKIAQSADTCKPPPTIQSSRHERLDPTHRPCWAVGRKDQC